MEMENIGFHEQVREAYLALAKANDHERWAIVDANTEMDRVEEKIWETVKEKMEL
jgi:thymidylate kinase